IWARREGIIGELALARQNFGPGIEERTWLDRNPRPRTIDGAVPLSSVRLGLDRRDVNHRCSEHCKAQPSQTGFNAHEAPLVRILSEHTPPWLTQQRQNPRRHHSVAGRVKFPTIEARKEMSSFAPLVGD